MNTNLNRFYIALAAACALGFSVTASAQNRPEGVTDAEWAMTPPYCPYTMSEKGHQQPHIRKWVGVMGDGFFHMHHYCWALVHFHRAERAGLSSTERQFLRRGALGDFKYVVRNTSEDFILLPEIYTWIGRTEILLRDPKNAGEAFAKAWELKPDYWPPYYHWAEYLQSHGKKSTALKVVKSGLQYSPNAKPLRLLLRHLGSKSTDLPPPAEPPKAEAARETDSTKGSAGESASLAK